MKFKLLISIATFLCWITTGALSFEPVFQISGIDASQFPTVKASFIALDVNEKSYVGLDPTNFVVVDNGITLLSSSVSVDCFDSIDNPPVSVILVLDKSTSMGYLYSNGEKRWDWVKEGATSFINTFNFSGGSRIGMIAFTLVSNIACPFTQNKLELIDSLKKLSPGGGTDYTPPFCDNSSPKYGVAKMFQEFSPNPKVRRIVVFLTDGEPSIPPDVDSIRTVLQDNNIQVYAITLAMPMNGYLSDIANYSGGRAYAVYSKEELNEIYKYIALDIQKKQFCNLIWTAPFGCSDLSKSRTVSITFKPQSNTQEKRYMAPQSSIAPVDLSFDPLEFDNPNINSSVEKDLTFTPRNSDLLVDSMKVSPPTYFQVVNWNVGRPDSLTAKPPFLQQKDKPRTIRVRFTQGSVKSYRQASLIFAGSPCPPSVTLIGGITQIRIITPNGGEVYSTCDSIDIKWVGVESTKAINLAYSLDSGKTWILIASNLKGLHYMWLPPAPGLKYMIRGTVSAVSENLWAIKQGGIESELGNSIAVSKTAKGTYIYITGTFEGTSTIAGQTIISRGGTDIYLAKFDSDGNPMWVETAGSPGNDSSAGVCVDDADNAYITGSCYSGIQFGNMYPTLIDGLKSCFIARYAYNGKTPTVEFIKASNMYNTFQGWGEKIRFSSLDRKVYVRGKYISSLVDGVRNINLPKVTVATPFTVSLNADLSVINASKGGIDYPDYSSNISFDPDGNKYTVGTFSGSLSIPPFSLKSTGKSDIYISKYGGTPGSEDVSDTTFSVQSPAITFALQSINFDKELLGSQKPILTDKLLCNTGSLPIEITNATILGANPKDFILTSNPVTMNINPGECIPIEITFQPTDIGPRSAQLIISGSCAKDITLNLIGDGVCSGVSEPIVDMGKVNLGLPKDLLVPCIFKNTNTTVIYVKPRLTGPNPEDFTIDESSVPVDTSACMALSVRFKPTKPGPRQAVIEFQLPNGCINQTTTLIGNGVETALLVNSIDWGFRRIVTSNDSFIVVKNNSILTASVDRIEFKNPLVEGEFKFGAMKQTPFDLASGDSFLLPVIFYPKNEVSYSNIVNLYAQENATPVEIQLDGKGSLPKMILTWNCDEKAVPGKSSIAHLEIENPSMTQDLTISQMDFQNKTEFKWIGGVPIVNEIIPINTKKIFDVVFAPISTGLRKDVISIDNDASPGPTPLVNSKFNAECDGLGLTSPQEIDFIGVLVCDNNTQVVALSNNSASTIVDVLSYSLSGVDMAAFDVFLPAGMTIAPGETGNIEVTFKPTEARPYSAILTLKTSIGYDVNINLKGQGEFLNFYCPNLNYNQKPGLPIFVPLKLKVAQLIGNNIKEFKATVSYDKNMLRYDRTTFKAFANWNWSPALATNKGVLEISGSGALPTPIDDEIGTIQFTVFLADVNTSKIKVKADLGTCLSLDSAITTVTYSPFCFMNGRLIITGGTKYFLSTPEPNPANETTTIKAGIALDGKSVLKIFNTMGELVFTVIDGEMTAGEYEFKIPTSKLPSGSYFIRMQSGPFSDTQKLLITK
jgi:hypothetical protein